MLARLRRRAAGRWIWLGIAPLLAGCGISGEIKDAAQKRRDSIEAARAQVDAIERDLRGVLEGPDVALFKGYSGVWERRVGEARLALDGAQALLDGRVRPLLEANKPESESAIIDLLRSARDETRRALAGAEVIPVQITTFRRYRDDAPEFVRRAQEALKGTKSRIEASRSVIEGAWGQYPNKKADLQERWAAVAGDGGLLEGVQDAAGRAKAELGKEEPDYVLLGRSADMADSLATHAIPASLEGLEDRVRQLGDSYEKRLSDMKIETRYRVEQWRTTWNEWSDFPSERDKPYRDIYVDEATFNQYDQRLERGLNIVVARGTGYEVWVNNVFEEVLYYHKYEIIRGQEREVTDWIEVNQPTYQKHEEHLGMALTVKPEGTYEDETIRTASPPGYGHVGNPRYGRWQRDDQGRSFWAFYGQYMFMRSLLWGPGYRHNVYQNDWNRWGNYRGRGEPYYGSERQFGTKGTWTRRKYANSTFAQGGGFRDRPSVRRGVGRRARGPGGRGK